MNLRIQDPTWSDSSYLMEEILEACQNADSGAGTFSFASVGGIRLLLKDQTFEAFLQRYPFQLIVGVDAVTTIQALELLASIAKMQPNLQAKAFLDDSSNALFHPKFTWFRSKNSATWIVGSGNLTPGGLRGNVEAFSVQTVSRDEHDRLEKRWREWLSFHYTHLLPLGDQAVLDQARQNLGWELSERKSKGLIQELLAEEPDGKVTVSALRSPQAAVLIAEIPRASNRWNQANFSLETFQHYFGATPGRTQRILLTHVSIDGTLGPEESRPSVAVKSRNFRFELEAASGVDYPAVGRPIAVFLRAGTRTFRYHLMMPTDSNYRRIEEFLAGKVTVSGSKVKRYETDALTLATVWPKCPVLAQNTS